MNLKKVCFLIILIFPSILLFADFIPDNSHAVERIVKIRNCDNYSDYTFIGYISGDMIDKPIFRIFSDTSLEAGYKFNSLQIMVIKNDILEKNGGFSSITEEYIESKAKYLQNIKRSTQYYTNNYYFLIKDELYYEITNITNSIITIKLKTRVLSFKDGTIREINY